MKMKLPRTRKRISLGGVAALLVGSQLIAQILGFLRTKLVNANFVAVPAVTLNEVLVAVATPVAVARSV